MFFNPTVAEVRHFFYHAWHKSLCHTSLSPIEQIAVHWMQLHPEYHLIFNGPIEALQEAQFLPENGLINPFLHLSMHLSISEQISIDQPPGIRQASLKLSQKFDDEHKAQHAIMECLGQTLWQAQRNETEPDSDAYLESIQNLSR